MAKKKNEISIRSSAAEYLTYVASAGEQEDSIEIGDFVLVPVGKDNHEAVRGSEY